jgi:hypothetical protein
LIIPAQWTTVPALRRLPYRSIPPTLVALGALVCTYAVTSPDGRPLKLLVLLIALAAALALTPHAFIGASALGFAVSTAVTAPVVPSFPVPLYFSDAMVLVIALRGVLPRDRAPSNRALEGLPAALFTVWAILMAAAAIRAMNVGVNFSSAVRGDLALVYWPLLYFGFTRALRERALEVSALWRYLAAVTLGLAGWMFLARVLNLPFHDPGLAKVSTGVSSTVQRNFGFAGAFIVYPAVALVGVAGMAHGGSRRSQWAVLASVGALATLLTLVRGEIFSLALAAVLVLWLRPRKVGTSARVRTAVQFSFAIAAVVIGIVAVSPTLGEAIVQRAVPFTHQAPGAKANAEYRQKAVETGVRVARQHPLGLGVLDTARLDAEGIDPGYLAHSGVGTQLLVGGWPLLGFALLTILAVIRRSFAAPFVTPWSHAAFVAVLTMLAVYSITAAGLAGDPWVMPLGALAVALRFTLQPAR